MLGRHRIASLVSSVFAMVLLVLVFGGSVIAAPPHDTPPKDPANTYEDWAKNGYGSGLDPALYGQNPNCVSSSGTNSIGAIWLATSSDYTKMHGGAGGFIDVGTSTDNYPVYIYGSVYGCGSSPVSHKAEDIYRGVR